MSDSTAIDGIRTATHGAVLEVTIDRPKANAIDLAASRRLNAVFTAFRDDPALRVAIVTGAGERFFSPGWDLKGAASGEESDEDWGPGGFGGPGKSPPPNSQSLVQVCTPWPKFVTVIV